MKLRRLCLSSVFATSLIVLAPATITVSYASEVKMRLDQWYAALGNADSAALGKMLSKNAKIILKDLNISQDRDTFLRSMDDWAATIEGGALRHKIISIDETEAIIDVCYDFIENDILMRERFIFEGDTIMRQEQEQSAAEC